MLNFRRSSAPSDSKTPTGFLIAYILESIVTLHVVLIITVPTSFGVNNYIFIIEMTTFLRSFLRHISENIKIEQNRLATAKEFIDFIEFQSGAKQLSFVNSIFFWKWFLWIFWCRFSDDHWSTLRFHIIWYFVSSAKNFETQINTANEQFLQL